MSGLTTAISGEIRERGAMTCARFMELVLYAPGLGYYERAAGRVGRGGDFYTSVSAGPLFGELLALQFAEWLDDLCKIQSLKCKACLVEAGAHDGKLAADILGWLQSRRPELFARIEYWIIEPSSNRQAWQRETLQKFSPQVRWLAGLPPASGHPPFHGVIFSNELLDALPVHRLGWSAAEKKWFEWGVDWQDEKFIWRRLDGEITTLAPQLPDELLAVLPDGFTTEAGPAAEQWWRQAAGALASGKLVAIDYGLGDAEFFLPQRGQGTLRAYHRHHAVADLLAQVGEQDLTAHVNFTCLQTAGEAAGLRTVEFVSQTCFLTRLVKKFCAGEITPEKFAATRARQFQTLTHPEHLGRSFRVLVQSRAS